MFKKTLLTLAVVVLFASGRAMAEEPLKLEKLLAEAETGSPELAALRSKYMAAGERVPQAGALPDPMFGLGIVNLPVDSFAFDRDPMTGKMIEIEQMLPFFGKRALRRGIAGEEARALEDEYSERMLTQHAEIKTVYYELYAIKRALEFLDKDAELLDVFKKTAQSRYSVGAGSLKDVIKAQLETAMTADKKIELQKQERTKRAYLGALIGREEPVLGAVEDLSPTKIGQDRKALAEAAIKNRPGLKAADARVRKGAAMMELANKEYYPDFTVKADYMSREKLNTGMDQPDMASLMVSVNLPVWRDAKLAPAVREASLERNMAENEKDSLKNEIYYKIDSLLGQIEQDDRLLKLYKDVVIPQATEDINAGLAGYEVGKLDFLTLLDSRRSLLDYETSYYNTLAEREKSVAELEAVVGGEFK